MLHLVLCLKVLAALMVLLTATVGVVAPGVAFHLNPPLLRAGAQLLAGCDHDAGKPTCPVLAHQCRFVPAAWLVKASNTKLRAILNLFSKFSLLSHRVLNLVS